MPLSCTCVLLMCFTSFLPVTHAQIITHNRASYRMKSANRASQGKRTGEDYIISHSANVANASRRIAFASLGSLWISVIWSWSLGQLFNWSTGQHGHLSC